jgi:hypothetical protein
MQFHAKFHNRSTTPTFISFSITNVTRHPLEGGMGAKKMVLN